MTTAVRSVSSKTLGLVATAGIIFVGNWAEPARSQEAQAEFRRRELMAVNVDGTGLRTIPGSERQTYGSPDWSPDGKWIACDTWSRGQRLADARVLVMRADGSEVRDIGPGAMPSWSPDGRQLAAHTYGGAGSIFVMNADGSGRAAIVPHWGSPRWSPTGGRIVAANSDGGMTLFNLATGEEHTLLAEVAMNHGLSISPDGGRICFADRAGSLRVAAIAEEPALTESKAIVEGGLFGHSSWSPDGKRIVFAWQRTGGDDVERLYLFDVDGARAPELLKGLDASGPCSDPDWSPDGKQILFRRELPAEDLSAGASGQAELAELTPEEAEAREQLLQDVHEAAGELVSLRNSLDERVWPDVNSRYTTTEAAKLLIAFYRGNGTLPGFRGTDEEARGLRTDLEGLRAARAQVLATFALVAEMDAKRPAWPLCGKWRVTKVGGAGGLAADALELYDPDPVGPKFMAANGAALLVTGGATWLFEAALPEGVNGGVDLSVVVRGDTVYRGRYEAHGEQAKLRLSVMNAERADEVGKDPRDGGVVLELRRME